jgi:replicative DNA helicase
MEEPELRKDRAREVEYISKGLADMSRELNVAMIILSQLSGLAEKLGDDEMPNMSHFKESQGIPENADAIITLHNFKRRENPFNMDGSYKMQEISCLIEQRYGFSGCLTKFMGDMRTCLFTGQDTSHEQ